MLKASQCFKLVGDQKNMTVSQKIIDKSEILRASIPSFHIERSTNVGMD